MEVSDYFATTRDNRNEDTLESIAPETCDIEDFKPSQIHSQHDSASIRIEPFYNITPRLVPESPHAIIEEDFKSNPWAMLVATIFLTKTTAAQCRPVMRKFFQDFPTPHELLSSSPDSLEAYFDTLGMKKRAGMIWRMTYQYVSGKWSRAGDLHGIGKYGEDAFRLFILAHTDVDPDDRYLRLYLDWLKTGDHMERLGDEDSENFLLDPLIEHYAITLK